MRGVKKVPEHKMLRAKVGRAEVQGKDKTKKKMWEDIYTFTLNFNKPSCDLASPEWSRNSRAEICWLF